MHKTHSTNGRHPHRLVGVLLPFLLICVLACSHAAAGSGKPEVTQTEANREYRCRACMALSSVFFREMLQPAMETQRQVFRDGARRGSKSAEAGMRQRLVVNTHEAIDNLCRRVRALHAESSSRDSHAGTGTDQSNVDDVSGTRRSRRDAVDRICTSVLEELDDAFSTKAYNTLKPERIQADAVDAEKKETGVDYHLREAGIFCEEQRMCTPHLVYRILQEDEEERRMLQLADERRQQHTFEGGDTLSAAANAFPWIGLWWHFIAAQMGGSPFHVLITLAVSLVGVASFLLLARCRVYGAAAAAATEEKHSIKN